MSEKKPPISPNQVTAWLQKNPDFLVTHPELVPGALKADDLVESGNIVSFEQYSLQRLRKDLGALRSQLDDLVGTSKRNSVLVEGMLLTVEHIIGSTSEENLKERLEESSLAYFQMHAVMCLNMRTEWGRQLRTGLLKNKAIHYGEIDAKLAKELFEAKVQSAVICMLPEGRPRGLIAFAGEENSLFDRRENMDSLLIEHIAAVIRARLNIGWKDGPKQVD